VRILRATDVSFERDGDLVVTPFSLSLEAGARGQIVQPNALAASVAARICAAIVRPSRGAVYVGEFETRLQPPQAKRLVGFVDAAGFGGDAHALRCEIAFRADVWNLDKSAAQSRAAEILEVLGDGTYARAIALALVAEVALVVLDQPTERFVVRTQRLVPQAGIVHTAVGASARVTQRQVLTAAR
jgi:ABC-type Na+ transport system ATPase subunit NatA